MRYFILIFACLFLFAGEVYPAGRVMTFTTYNVDDCDMNSSAQTTNTGTATVTRVAHSLKRLKTLIRCNDCDDSLMARVFTIDTALLTLDCAAVKNVDDADDSIDVYALKATTYEYGFEEAVATWTLRWATDGNWQALGCSAADTDYVATRIASLSIAGWSAATNPVINVKPAFDSGYHAGFLLVGRNFDADTIQFRSAEAITGTAPSFHIVATETNKVQNRWCDNGAFGTGAASGCLGEFRMLSYKSKLDSVQLAINDNSTSNDSMFALVYDAFSNDSGPFIERSTDTVITNGGAACEYYTLHFAGTEEYGPDSVYLIGGFVLSSAGNFRFCTSTPSGTAIDTGYYITAINDPLGAHANAVNYDICFKAFFTAITATGQVIIIGSCWSEETPYFDERTGQWSNISL